MLVNPLYAFIGSAGLLDPASLAMSLLCRASFGGSPWAGTASAGSSGGRNLAEATNPPSVGAAVNTFTPADFDGTDDQLTNATTISTVCPDAEGSIGCLFYADAAAADPGASSYYQNPSFLVNAGDGYLGFGFNASGVVLGSYDSTSGTFDAVSAPASTGAWHFGQARWDNSAGGGAGLLEVRVDSGAWQSLAKLVEASLSAGGINVGTSFSNAFFFNGKMLELFAATSRFDDATFDDIKSAFNAKYGLAL